MLAVQKQGGCADNPGTAHAVEGLQGWHGEEKAVLLGGENVPMPQSVHCALEVAPGEEEKVPPGHGAHAAAACANVPAGHVSYVNAQSEAPLTL